jgi:hypothetical protein
MSEPWNTENPWVIESPGVLRLNGTSVKIERCARIAPIMWLVTHQGAQLTLSFTLAEAKTRAMKEVRTLIDVGIEP